MFPNVGIFLDNMAIRIDRVHRDLLRKKTANDPKRSLFAQVIGVNRTYCAVYNLTERRFVAPFENLTLLGLMMGRRGRERNGGIGYGATIQAGLFAIDSQALPPGATSREECDVGRIR